MVLTSERKCENCGTIDFGIWGTIGLIGYSLVCASIGYALSSIIDIRGLYVLMIIYGFILLFPMWIINYHEEKEISNNDKI